MTIKYELYSEEFEVHLSDEEKNVAWSEEELIDAYEHRSFFCPQLQDSFDTMEEAQAELERVSRCHYCHTSLERGCGCYYLRVELYFVEPMEYDDDGEIVGGDGPCAYSVQPYMPEIEDLEGEDADEDDDEEEDDD